MQAKRNGKGGNLEFPAVQTSSLDQWWCQQLSRDQFLNKKRRCMHHDSDGGQCYSARRGVGDGAGDDGMRRDDVRGSDT